jgi:carbon storage regulator
MLVLTRKIDQGIVISGNIFIRVLGVERDRVKIGVSAPLDVAVLRQELLDRETPTVHEEGSPRTTGSPSRSAMNSETSEA